MKEDNRKQTAAIVNVKRATTGTLANLAAIINFHTRNTKRSRFPTKAAANSETTSNQSSDSDTETDSSLDTDSDDQ